MPDGSASDSSAARSLSREQVNDLGLALFTAEKDRVAIDPITDRFPEITVVDAYAVQQAYAKLRVDQGAQIVGHKIGATSRAIQELFEIDTPDYGHLFDDMRCHEDRPISTSELIQPLAEPEIAFVLSEELAGPGIKAGDVLDASQGVVACLEIIDSRIVDWRIRLPDTIADNGSSSRFVIGRDIVPVNGRDLIAESVVFERNGEVVGQGRGAEVLGDPAVAAAWLVNAIGEYGQTLPAGAILLSGSITSAVPIETGDQFVARFQTIGYVSCSFLHNGERRMQ